MLAMMMGGFWLAGVWVTSSFVIDPVIDNPNYKSWDLDCGDGDTLMAFDHGFVDAAGDGITPDFVKVQSVPSVALGELPNFGVQVNDTQIVLTKQGATGSGGTPAAKIYAMRPHSIIQ